MHQQVWQECRVLTNNQYFGGSLEDLLLARQACELPLLRKEFMVDEYQVLEAKANGADAILLIAACLERQDIQTLSTLAQQLGMEVLLEVHNADELEKSIMPSIDMIGVNNRDLTSFRVSLEQVNPWSIKSLPNLSNCRRVDSPHQKVFSNCVIVDTKDF